MPAYVIRAWYWTREERSDETEADFPGEPTEGEVLSWLRALHPGTDVELDSYDVTLVDG